MKVKPGNQTIFILCSTFLMAATISCNSQSQSNKENQIVHSKDDSIRLKYTTGVRSILEDSKGNIWFGSYNEGVCLLHNGKLQYFTTENGLSDNQVRSIYEDKNGIIWFECGQGLSIYDGQKMTVYKERNYDSKNGWKLKLVVTFGLKAMKRRAITNLKRIRGCINMTVKNFYYRTLPCNKPKLGARESAIQFQHLLSKVKMERFGLELMAH